MWTMFPLCYSLSVFATLIITTLRIIFLEEKDQLTSSEMCMALTVYSDLCRCPKRHTRKFLIVIF